MRASPGSRPPLAARTLPPRAPAAAPRRRLVRGRARRVWPRRSQAAPLGSQGVGCPQPPAAWPRAVQPLQGRCGSSPSAACSRQGLPWLGPSVPWPRPGGQAAPGRWRSRWGRLAPWGSPLDLQGPALAFRKLQFSPSGCLCRGYQYSTASATAASPRTPCPVGPHGCAERGKPKPPAATASSGAGRRRAGWSSPSAPLLTGLDGRTCG
mmetsp:Transcript_59644/g.184976  ORF Transcript_59644/g.184976 Transcript_59644/m.184976 type:complete len:209 (-) Transcript_59644:2096-2722(-)